MWKILIPLVDRLTKLTKGGFVSFVSDQPKRFPEKKSAEENQTPERLLTNFRRARSERLNSPDPSIREIWEKISTWPVIHQCGFSVRVGLLVKTGMPEAQATVQIFASMEPFVNRRVIPLQKEG